MKDELIQSYNVNVSSTTIRRRLCEQNLQECISVKKPLVLKNKKIFEQE